MNSIKDCLLLARDEYEAIVTNLRNGVLNRWYTQQDTKELAGELKKAILLDSSDLPADVVRLNSTVKVCDDKKKVMELTVVLPQEANIRQRKISILSPIGTALIGYQKGKTVLWRVPAGETSFEFSTCRNAPDGNPSANLY